MSPVAAMMRRAEAMRARLALRQWEYRQRHGAKGTWSRLRYVLARAERVYVVEAAAIDALLAEGFGLQPVGRELEPMKRLVVVPPERAEGLERAESIPVALSVRFLEASNLVLVPFAPAP